MSGPLNLTPDERKLLGDSLIYSLSVGGAMGDPIMGSRLIELYTKVTGKKPLVERLPGGKVRVGRGQ